MTHKHIYIYICIYVCVEEIGRDMEKIGTQKQDMHNLESMSHY